MKKNTPNTNDLRNYKRFYSDSGFWDKLQKIGKFAGRKLLRYALILYYTFKSGNMSLKDRAIIVGALGYLILPTDLIPDFIPLLGLTDDLAALKLAYDTIKRHVTPDIRRRTETKLDQLFGPEAEQ